MTVFEFDELPERDQLDQIYREGVYIGKRVKGGKPALLYQLEGFYIEVLYSQYRRYIHRVKCFSSTAPIEPYLEQIPIGLLV